jgi:predicted transcriptional regulator of viral defense system
MKLFEPLARLGVFSMADAELLTGNLHTARTAVARLVDKGYVRKARNGLYAAVDPATGGLIPSKYQIACAINTSAYLTHHTALEFHGFANQVFYEVYVASIPKFRDFSFEGVTYRRVVPKIHVGVIEPRNTVGIRVTDLERTVIDSIRDVEKIGGVDELLNCLGAIPYLEESKLKIYLDAYGVQALYQKAGFLLEKFVEQLQLSQEFVEYCRSKAGKSTRYFLAEAKKDGMYVREWRLVVPDGLFGGDGYGGGPLV